jgi:superfamily I DNA and/or RNA helicase
VTRHAPNSLSIYNNEEISAVVEIVEDLLKTYGTPSTTQPAPPSLSSPELAPSLTSTVSSTARNEIATKTETETETEIESIEEKEEKKTDSEPSDSSTSSLLRQSDIGVICAFRAQVLLCREALRAVGLSGVNVGSVEDFQVSDRLGLG